MFNNPHKLLTLALIAFAFIFSSCDKFDEWKDDDDDNDIEDFVAEYDCIEAEYMDPGMCSGAWFRTEHNTYFEVFTSDHMNPLKGLEPGEWISFTCAPYDASCLIQCEALGEFEANLCDCATVHQVEILELCNHCDIEPGYDDDDDEDCVYMKVVDPGLCGGVWCENEEGKLFEIMDMGSRTTNLNVGDEMNIILDNYETDEHITCLAMTGFEASVYESGLSFERVRFMEECR